MVRLPHTTLARSGYLSSNYSVVHALRVQDLSTSLIYYCEVLGFSRDWTTGQFAGLSRDGWSIYLCERGQGQLGTWLWIGVEDVDRMYGECQSKGAIIRREITSYPWAREFLVADPDGHVLRFGGSPEAPPAD